MLMFLPLASAQAALQRYGASEHESSWKSSSTTLRCALSHDIPVYGEALFEQVAGQDLQFRLKVKQKPHKTGMARLISSAPAWRHEVLERDLGQVGYIVGAEPIKLPTVLSRRVLLELERGMFPTFNFRDWADGRDEVQVAISSVNLRAALGDFRDCVSGMLPFSFKHVRSSALYYRSGQITVGDKEKKRLDELVRYLNADPAVKTITISAYTDSIGYRYINKQVSRRRAEAVRDYIVSQGVAKSKFKIRAYGETRPRASNRTAKGRAKNRLVEVKLSK